MRYQKILMVGSSLMITIPAPVCRELKIKRGDSVRLLVCESRNKYRFGNELYIEIWPVIEQELV